MKKTIVVYGSTTGTCEIIAGEIATNLGVGVINVADLSADMIAEYDNLILGTSTWGCGELQDDWYSGLDLLKGVDLKDKTVAIFGCGDSASYSDSFCGAMAELYKTAIVSGANVVGAVPTDGYSFDASEAVIDGKFVGLALDNDNEADKTSARIEAWIEAISPSL